MSCSRLPPFEPSAATIPTPASLTSSKKKLRAVVRHNPHLDEVIVAQQPARTRPPARRYRAHQTAAARAVRSRHRFSRRSAQLAAHLAQRRADTHRLRSRRTKLDVHDASPASSRVATASFGCEPVGCAAAARHRSARSGTRCDARCPTIPRRRRPSTRRLAAAGIGAGNPIVVVHVSAGNPFRRWPSASFVELVCRLASADPKRRIILTSGPSDAAAAAAIARDARARLAADAARGDRRMRRVRSRRASRRSSAGLRSISEATADRFTSQARPACRLWDCMGPRCRCDRSRFEARRFISAAAEVHGSAVPSVRSAATASPVISGA